METDDDKLSQITPVRDEGETIPLRGRSSRKKKPFFERRNVKKIRAFISNKVFTFYRMHLLYLLMIAIIGSIIIYNIESNNPVYNDPEKWYDAPHYIDVLFNSISAVCCCGLNTSDISLWRTSSLVIVIIMTELGCLGFSTCIIVPLLRCRRAKKLEKIRRENYFDAYFNYFFSFHISLFIYLFI